MLKFLTRCKKWTVKHAVFPLEAFIKLVAKKVLPRQTYDRMIYAIGYSTAKIFSKQTHPSEFPFVYHFLMNNYCNANCVFCNQVTNLSVEGKKAIDLATFQQMTANIPMAEAKTFYLSGGGEPLLTPDLFKIIAYLNSEFPHIAIRIKTNGLLIGKFADSLAQAGQCALDIAVHGTEEVNNAVMGIQDSRKIFEGIALLNEKLTKLNKKMNKVFRTVVWKYNIENIPALVEKAASLGIDALNLYFCRFSTTRTHLDPKDSLVYHPDLYYRVVTKAEKIARRLNLQFNAPPLVPKYYLRLQKVCPAAWTTMLIDWNGVVYPCASWEVLICEKINSCEYDFGNVLKSHAKDFWHNKSWVDLRLTRISEDKKGRVGECLHCPHNPFRECNFKVCSK